MNNKKRSMTKEELVDTSTALNMLSSVLDKYNVCLFSREDKEPVLQIVDTNEEKEYELTLHNPSLTLSHK